MFDPRLEEIIDAAIEDGVLTETERRVLDKKALESGCDLDEFHVILEGRLQKKQRELQALKQAAKPASNKFGTVRKCPQCGAVVEAGSVRCSECGYTYSGIEANSSVEKLSRLIREAEERYSANLIGDMFGSSKRMTIVPSIITEFPVPTTKEDLLELILFLEPKSKGISSLQGNDYYAQKKGKAFKRKYEECVSKAKLFFPDDPQFKAILHKKSGFFGKLFGKK